MRPPRIRDQVKPRVFGLPPQALRTGNARKTPLKGTSPCGVWKRDRKGRWNMPCSPLLGVMIAGTCQLPSTAHPCRSSPRLRHRHGASATISFRLQSPLKWQLSAGFASYLIVSCPDTHPSTQTGAHVGETPVCDTQLLRLCYSLWPHISRKHNLR